MPESSRGCDGFFPPHRFGWQPLETQLRVHYTTTKEFQLEYWTGAQKSFITHEGVITHLVTINVAKVHFHYKLQNQHLKCNWWGGGGPESELLTRDCMFGCRRLVYANGYKVWQQKVETANMRHCINYIHVIILMVNNPRIVCFWTPMSRKRI